MNLEPKKARQSSPTAVDSAATSVHRSQLLPSSSSLPSCRASRILNRLAFRRPQHRSRSTPNGPNAPIPNSSGADREHADVPEFQPGNPTGETHEIRRRTLHSTRCSVVHRASMPPNFETPRQLTHAQLEFTSRFEHASNAPENASNPPQDDRSTELKIPFKLDFLRRCRRRATRAGLLHSRSELITWAESDEKTASSGSFSDSHQKPTLIRISVARAASRKMPISAAEMAGEFAPVES